VDVPWFSSCCSARAASWAASVRTDWRSRLLLLLEHVHDLLLRLPLMLPTNPWQLHRCAS